VEGGAFVSVSSHPPFCCTVVAAPSVGGSLMYAWCKRHGSTNARASSAGVLVGPSGVGW
jgi:hypothetical protein